jgi:AraC family transcriptional regulator
LIESHARQIEIASIYVILPICSIFVKPLVQQLFKSIVIFGLDFGLIIPMPVKDLGQVGLASREQEPLEEERRLLSWRGLSIEHVRINGLIEYDFKWVGSTHYLALHDIRLGDHEVILQEFGTSRLLDLRDRMTFIPKGCEGSGWSKPARSANSFIALYFDPAIVAEELHERVVAPDTKPMLYFEHPGLLSTMHKLRTLFSDPAVVDSVYAETLGLLAAIEIARLQNAGAEAYVRESGRLSAEVERLIREFISDNLQHNISLGDLAGIARLSRFHFTRSFKKTVGLPPHQFILQSRVERAKRMLLSSDLAIGEIAHSLGFANQGQFTNAFRKVMGVTPAHYRRTRR